MVASAVSEEYVAGAVQYDEESRARLCDSGLPDPDICDVLCAPPRDTEVVREAWSRGCARWFLVPRLSCPPSQYREKLRECRVSGVLAIRKVLVCRRMPGAQHIN